MNIIIRPLFNRPEMFQLSIESEIEARKVIDKDNYVTLFCVEYGAPKECYDVISNYPFPHAIVQRKFKHHGWGNILEGFKMAFKKAESYVLNIEDDCVLHPTYFLYVEKVTELIDNYSVINSGNRHYSEQNKGKTKEIRPTMLFEGPGCIMSKYFFLKYVKPYATYEYYQNRGPTIAQIDKRNEPNENAKYHKSKGNLFKHVGWDGMVNRLIDTANYEEGLCSYSPSCDRHKHIGFYGQNRPGQFPIQGNFETRVNFLREAINDPEKLKQLDGRYSDYINFDPTLDGWVGELILED